MKTKIGLVALGAVMCLCANPPEPAHAASAMACDAYARDYAQRASMQGQALGRGAVGTLVGAGIGAAFGGAAIGAAVGGGMGLISGGASRQQTANRMYTAAYQDCMSGRVQ
jgi:hypothetical protein